LEEGDKKMKKMMKVLSFGILIVVVIVCLSAKHYLSIPAQDEAVRIANSHLEYEKQQWEQYPKLFFPQTSYLGNPILVNDTSGKEAYWVLSVCKENKVIGTLTITNRLGSIIQRVNVISRFDTPQNSYPEISLQEARTIIQNIANEKYNNVSVSEPRYIYSQVGETWMCNVYIDDNEISKIFLNPHCLNHGYIVYEETEQGTEKILESSTLGKEMVNKKEVIEYEE
jgi:hypothetical protein